MQEEDGYKPRVKRLAILLKVKSRKNSFYKKKYFKTYQLLLQETNFLHEHSSIQERIWYIINNVKSPLICKTCNSRSVPFNKITKTPRTFCSPSCASKSNAVKIRKRETFIKKYQCPTIVISQHVKQVIKQKYNVENISQLPEVKEKKKQTFLKKYGVITPLIINKQTIKQRYNVENISQLPEVKEKKKQTFLKKYGADNIRKSEWFKNYIKQKNLDKYGVPYLQQQHFSQQARLILFDQDHLKYLHHIKQLTLAEIAKLLNVSPTTVGRTVKKYNIDQQYYLNHSIFQQEIVEFLSTLNVPFIVNDRKTIYPKELDIFIPSYKIAIECNGIFWHSDLLLKDKLYHLTKTNLAQKHNINLIHIFENEWIFKQQIVMSRLKHILNKTKNILYARNCKIDFIDKQIANDFFRTTHLQSYSNRGNVNIGLYYNNELVSAMSLGPVINNKHFEWELLRFSCALNTAVVGACSRLFNFFIKIKTPRTIVSYSNKRWNNNGNIYQKLGFNYSHTTSPNYFYFKHDLNLQNKTKFQKHKLKNILEKYDPNLSEWENMQNNGYNRIWDCGNDVWIWKKT